jgi:hypothetical protein
LANPTVNVSATEWVVFVADAVNPELNARSLFRDSLPQFVEDLRASPAAAEKSNPAEPGPVGLIRFSAEGPIDKETALDVQLSYKNGRALGHWPRAKVRSAGLLWQDLRPAADQGASQHLPDGSWLAGLRTGGWLLQSGSTRESFLLYDIELPYPVAMKAAAGKDGKYTVAHGMDAPLLDLTFYKRGADDHWQTATLASLAKAAGFPTVTAPSAAIPQASSPSPAVGAAGRVVRMVVGGRVVTQLQSNSSASKSDSTPTTTLPASLAGIKGTDIALSPTAETDATVLTPWRAKLADAGVSSGEQDVVLKILARQALDSKRLTAIYRMDPAELNRILPLEIVPQPKKVSRIALVVVTGIDPAIGDELDRLIAKLGDPSWKLREAAMTEIKKMGIRARPRLEEAVKNKDTEIAYRAEQLLAAFSSDGGHVPDDAAAQ